VVSSAGMDSHKVTHYFIRKDLLSISTHEEESLQCSVLVTHLATAFPGFPVT
jgi:hypothetical protein